MTTIKGFRITADTRDDSTGPVSLTLEGDSGLKALRAQVGGTIEAYDVRHPDTDEVATIWCHDEAKMIPHHGNTLATFLMTRFGPGLFEGDYIAGDVVLTGIDFTSGDMVDLPAAWADLLAGLVEVTRVGRS